jgi:hypothetical protein
VPVVIDDRHARRDHYLAADAHVMPHVEGHSAVHGNVIADRQPAAVRDGDAHGQGVAKHGEPVTEDRLTADMKLDFSPDIRKFAKLCGRELSFCISATSLREK